MIDLQISYPSHAFLARSAEAWTVAPDWPTHPCYRREIQISERDHELPLTSNASSPHTSGLTHIPALGLEAQ